MLERESWHYTYISIYVAYELVVCRKWKKKGDSSSVNHDTLFMNYNGSMAPGTVALLAFLYHLRLPTKQKPLSIAWLGYIGVS